jgi:hypothetical protein
VGRLISTVVALALVAAACGSSSPKVSATWDPKAAAAVQANGTRLQQAFHGQCADLAQLPRVTYVRSSTLTHLPVPLAAAACTTLGDNVEISEFADAKLRDQFISRRATVLCARANKSHLALPGLRWVVGGTWSMQPDTENVGLKIAKALNATYRTTNCPHQSADWDLNDVGNVNGLAAALKKAGLGCSNFALNDRDLMVGNPHYQQIGFPGAYGTCTVKGGGTALVGSFRNGTVPLAAFLGAEQSYQCSASKDSRVVLGSDWIVYLNHNQNVDAIARALGGKPFGGACS